MARKKWPLFWGVGAIFLWVLAASEVIGGEEDLPFEAGEKLVYDVRWGILPIGQASLWVRNVVDYRGKKAYHISAEGRTNAFLSAFYEVDDFIQSFWDVESLATLAFQKVLNEGHYHINEIYLFDHDQRKVTWFNTRRREQRFDIPAGVQDALSCLYEFRRRPEIFLGRPIEMDVHQDEKNYIVSVDTLEREEVRVPAFGRVEAICVEPRAEQEGAFLRKGRMWVWFTDDEERIPVKVQVKAPLIGRLTAELVERRRQLEPQPSPKLGQLLQPHVKAQTVAEVKE